jgi:hypothetical protein
MEQKKSLSLSPLAFCHYDDIFPTNSNAKNGIKPMTIQSTPNGLEPSPAAGYVHAHRVLFSRPRTIDDGMDGYTARSK